ncbi:uroporphyrin-iii c tetrapyrrole (corrin porphyrin) methyltransferase [Moniliophthora roreri]|nr:uroporphyrin-iii c tetrapyrrole (corrin porphyrin) methyltransferase [Moniliophthora roreri]
MDILRLQSTNGGLLLYLDNDNPSGSTQIRPISDPLGALSRLRQKPPDFLFDDIGGTCANLSIYYDKEKDRYDSYIQMCEESFLPTFTFGYNVLGVFYGHSGVFVNPSHRAIALAREEGFKAKMLAGVSAEDCLFADLEFDPAILGCMTCEASECLARDRPFNPFIHNIIWQVGSIGITNMTFSNDKFSILVDRLEKDFAPNHTVVYYVGRVLPKAVSKIETFTVADLRKARAQVQSHFDVVSTLYVPPRDTGPVDPAPVGVRIDAIEAYRSSLKWSARNINRKLSYAYNRYESDVIDKLKGYVIPEGHRILQGSSAMKTFLTDLALKPRLLEEYREDPAAVVDRVDGLTEDEKYGLKLGTEGPVYALMSRTAEDVSSSKKLSRSDLLGGKPTAFVGLVVIIAVVV